MAKPARVCYRHPERTAKRECFFCKQPICPTCQVSLDHHFFCGEDCRQQWLRKPKKSKTRPNSSKAKKAAVPAVSLPDPSAAAPTPETALPAAPALETPAASARDPLVNEEIQRLAWSVEVLRGHVENLARDQKNAEQKLRDQDRQSQPWWRKPVLPVALICLLLGGYLVWAVIIPTPSPPSSTPAPSVYDLEYPGSLQEEAWAGEAPDLELPAFGHKLLDSRITLFGTAAGAVTVRLLQNGEAAGSATVEQGEFSFANVTLAPGLNTFQVEAKDAAGRKSYSLARFLERIRRGQGLLARVPALQGLNFMRGPRERPELVLSFDAGSSARQAEEVLNVLKAQGITTTIFLTGQFIERHPDLVHRIVADGHEVGNHTYAHPHLTTFEKNRRHATAAGVDREMVSAELQRTAKLFEQITGQAMTGWWRAPFGEHNGEIRRWAEEAGFKHVDWTRGPGGRNYDMLDWVADVRSRHYLKADQLQERLVGLDQGNPGAANGGIILMHLGSDRVADFPAAILPQAIARLQAKGYRFVTVTELFRE